MRPSTRGVRARRSRRRIARRRAPSGTGAAPARRSRGSRQAAEGAPSARPTRWSQAGGNGNRTSPKWCRAITARRSGFGIPFRFTLSSAASPNIVSISCSKPSAGRTSQTKCAVSSPTFRKRCGVPAGTGRGRRAPRRPSSCRAGTRARRRGSRSAPPGPGGRGPRRPRRSARRTSRRRRLAVRVGRGRPEDQGLAGDMVGEGLAGGDHMRLLCSR